MQQERGLCSSVGNSKLNRWSNQYKWMQAQTSS
nr:MAG TPA: hypothetical protein [Caudoviricetes sp.]